MKTFFEWINEALAPAIPQEVVAPVAKSIVDHAKRYVSYQQGQATTKNVQGITKSDMIQVPGFDRDVKSSVKLDLSIEDFDPATNKLGNAFYRYSGVADRQPNLWGNGGPADSVVTITLAFQKSAFEARQAVQLFAQAEQEMTGNVAFTLTHELGHRQRVLPAGQEKSYAKAFGGRMANLNTPANADDPHWDAYQDHPAEVEANLAAVRSKYESIPPQQRAGLTLDQLLGMALPAPIARTYLKNRRYWLMRLHREKILTKEMNPNDMLSR